MMKRRREMKNKLYKVLLGVSVLAMAACSPAVGIMAADNGTQTETQETENITIEAVGALNFSETRTNQGNYIKAVRIEYSGEVDASAVDYTSYLVKGYNVVGTYVNNTGEWGDCGTSGKYVFVLIEEPINTETAMYKTHTNYGGMDYYTPPTLYISQLSDIKVNEEGKLDEEGNVTIAGFGMESSEQYNLIADEFQADQYTMQVDGEDYSIMYRLFVPEGYENGGADLASLPMVIYYHGGGEGGDNNIMPILDSRSAQNFATDEWQSEHPCFVLVPQNPIKHGGEEPFMTAAVQLIQQVMGEYNVDQKRIYTMGTSAGTKSAVATDIAMPDQIAGTLLASAAMFEYTQEEHEAIKDIPTWLITAADEIPRRLDASEAFVDTASSIGREAAANVGDEAWNGYLTGYEAEQLAEEQIELAEQMGTNLLYTHYQVNTIEPDCHLNYLHAYNNTAILEWLFDQSK